jgi:hypothetical protein
MAVECRLDALDVAQVGAHADDHAAPMRDWRADCQRGDAGQR